jgi:hypothetical protein
VEAILKSYWRSARRVASRGFVSFLTGCIPKAFSRNTLE